MPLNSQQPIVVGTDVKLFDPRLIAEYVGNLQRSPGTLRDHGTIVRVRPGDWHQDLSVEIGRTTLPARPHAHRLDAHRTGWVMLGCVRIREHREHLRSAQISASRVAYVLVKVRDASPLAIVPRAIYMTPVNDDTLQLARFVQMERQFHAQ